MPYVAGLQPTFREFTESDTLQFVEDLRTNCARALSTEPEIDKNALREAILGTLNDVPCLKGKLPKSVGAFLLTASDYLKQEDNRGLKMQLEELGKQRAPGIGRGGFGGADA